MHLHILIFAILSVRALASFILTAHDHTDTTCSQKAIGNQIDFSKLQCVLYQPEQPDAFIYVEWWTKPFEHIYNVTIFSDLNCKEPIGTISPNKDNTNDDPTCVSMGIIAAGPWGSARRSAFNDH